MSLKEPRRARETLEEPGRLWKNLGDLGRAWMSLKEPRRAWKHLKESGRVWKILEEFERVCKSLKEPGRVWKTLEEPGRVWKSLGEAPDEEVTPNETLFHRSLSADAGRNLRRCGPVNPTPPGPSTLSLTSIRLGESRGGMEVRGEVESLFYPLCMKVVLSSSPLWSLTQAAASLLGMITVALPSPRHAGKWIPAPPPCLPLPACL